MAMKSLLCLILLTVIFLGGCAASPKTASQREGDEIMREIIRDNPDYYRMWAEEAGR
jgi:PBP1b-binding outer membrane lipoprotein LpoB